MAIAFVVSSNHIDSFERIFPPVLSEAYAIFLTGMGMSFLPRYSNWF